MKQLFTSFFIFFFSFSSFCHSEALVINETFREMNMDRVFAQLKSK